MMTLSGGGMSIFIILSLTSLKSEKIIPDCVTSQTQTENNNICNSKIKLNFKSRRAYYRTLSGYYNRLLEA